MQNRNLYSRNLLTIIIVLWNKLLVGALCYDLYLAVSEIGLFVQLMERSVPEETILYYFGTFNSQRLSLNQKSTRLICIIIYLLRTEFYFNLLRVIFIICWKMTYFKSLWVVFIYNLFHASSIYWKEISDSFCLQKKELRIKRSHLSRDHLDRYGYSILTKLPKLLNETSVGLIIANKCKYIQKVNKVS